MVLGPEAAVDNGLFVLLASGPLRVHLKDITIERSNAQVVKCLHVHWWFETFNQEYLRHLYWTLC